ncbi:MAG: hypothetical protein ACO3NZ_06780 [Pirellulales bacterium]|jgi:hypothetical protein
MRESRWISRAAIWGLMAVLLEAACAQPPGTERQRSDPPEAQREQLIALLAAVEPAGQDPQQAEDLIAFEVAINPEARVKLRGRSVPERLVKDRTQRFLLEVINEAGLQAPLRLRAFDRAEPGEHAAEWFSIHIVENSESTAVLSGARTEWKLIELYSSEAGTRAVRIAADAGTGTQDLGFRAEVDLVIDVEEVP